MTNFVETDCTIEHQGQQFTANGAWRVGNHALVYVDGNQATDWHGNVIGRVEHVSQYCNPLTGYRMDCIRVRMTDGTWWYGRYGPEWSQACKLRLATT